LSSRARTEQIKEVYECAASKSTLLEVDSIEMARADPMADSESEYRASTFHRRLETLPAFAESMGQSGQVQTGGVDGVTGPGVEGQADGQAGGERHGGRQPPAVVVDLMSEYIAYSSPNVWRNALEHINKTVTEADGVAYFALRDCPNRAWSSGELSVLSAADGVVTYTANKETHNLRVDRMDGVELVRAEGGLPVSFELEIGRAVSVDPTQSG